MQLKGSKLFHELSSFQNYYKLKMNPHHVREITYRIEEATEFLEMED